MNEATAGADFRHLDEREQTQAAAHAAPQALVIHEVVREEGELNCGAVMRRCHGPGLPPAFPWAFRC